MFFKLYKWYQIAQRIKFMLENCEKSALTHSIEKPILLKVFGKGRTHVDIL